MDALNEVIAFPNRIFPVSEMLPVKEEDGRSIGHVHRWILCVNRDVLKEERVHQSGAMQSKPNAIIIVIKLKNKEG